MINFFKKKSNALGLQKIVLTLLLLPLLVLTPVPCENVLPFLGDIALADTSDASAAARFKDYEIRVIRPKYFSKRKRFELGTEMLMVMNDAFVYSLLLSGIVTFHFSESLAVEGALGYGLSFDRSEKTTLFDEFVIKTQVFRTQYFGELSLLYTPIYGKVQLPEGRLVYFDTFLSFGGGMTGVEWRYSDYCQDRSAVDKNAVDIAPNRTVPYPTIAAGIGQKIYYSKSSALRFDLKTHTILYNAGDADCNQENPATGSKSQTNITLQFGASKFF